jgi:hypothetical protein
VAHGQDADDIVSKLDALVGPAPDAGNAVLTDEARVVRLPWTIYLAQSVPGMQLSPHYDIAWAGFDVMLLVALASTGYCALRRSRYLATAATVTAALLVVDAWFDVTTSPPSQLLESVLLAVAVELPLAVCAWLSRHTEQLAERRIVLLLRRRGRAGRRSAGR